MDLNHQLDERICTISIHTTTHFHRTACPSHYNQLNLFLLFVMARVLLINTSRMEFIALHAAINANFKGRMNHMYHLRQVIRYRLASLIIEAVQSGKKCELEILDRYEAIIFRELKNYLVEDV